MSDPNSDAQPPDIDVRQLAYAVRFVLLSIVLGLSYFAMKSSMAIDNFEIIFKDMLGGKPLPMSTVYVLQGRAYFVILAYLIPIVAVGTLFSRRVVASIYVLGATGLVAVIVSISLYQALSAPLFEITRQMGVGAGL